MTSTPIIYMDNAATSWPKPESVYRAMDHFMRDMGANPGRSGHSRSVDAARVVFDAREVVAELFGIAASERVVLAPNATHAANIALHGVLRRGDHVVTSCLEHNSIMRPLRYLERAGGIEVTVAPCGGDGTVSVEALATAVRPNTRMVAVTHASNVTGDLLPLREIGRLARVHGALFLVDAAQTAGRVAIDVETDCVDLLVFTGHKELLGPPGTGGLCLAEGVDVAPLIRGGTGSRSEFDEQPDFLPDRLEAGTPNTVGLAGLAAGVRQVLATGVGTMRDREVRLTRRLQRGLREIEGVVLQGRGDASRKVGIVSFLVDGLTPDVVVHRLDSEFRIMMRGGLHCAPAAHRALGSFPAGSVRAGLGAFSTEDDVDAVLAAVREIVRGR